MNDEFLRMTNPGGLSFGELVKLKTDRKEKGNEYNEKKPEFKNQLLSKDNVLELGDLRKKVIRH